MSERPQLLRWLGLISADENQSVSQMNWRDTAHTACDEVIARATARDVAQRLLLVNLCWVWRFLLAIVILILPIPGQTTSHSDQGRDWQRATYMLTSSSSSRSSGSVIEYSSSSSRSYWASSSCPGTNNHWKSQWCANLFGKISILVLVKLGKEFRSIVLHLNDRGSVSVCFVGMYAELHTT